MTEAIDITLGRTIKATPQLFLEELLRSGVKVGGGMVGNLGDASVDLFEKQLVELKAREAALQSVRTLSLGKVRDECVRELQSEIKEVNDAEQTAPPDTPEKNRPAGER